MHILIKSTYIEFDVDDKDLKFNVGGHVRKSQ